jgi:ABC-type nickel/cobalt efflux system permease component RcnA
MISSSYAQMALSEGFELMSAEILVLCGTAATIAFVHTLLGPDHYLPFVAMAKSRGWSVGKAVRTTVLCGSGHIVGSVVLGFVGIYASIQLGALDWIEVVRGDIAAWALVSVGLVWMAWGLRRGYKCHSHSHWHSHGDLRHRHEHNHAHEHAHVHHAEEVVQHPDGQRSIAGWAIFLVFVLGPCEPLIPILMFPAAKESIPGLIAVTAVFAVVTVSTMLCAVALSVWGVKAVRLPAMENFSEAIAGGTIACCGLSIAVLGL